MVSGDDCVRWNGSRDDRFRADDTAVPDLRTGQDGRPLTDLDIMADGGIRPRVRHRQSIAIHVEEHSNRKLLNPS